MNALPDKVKTYKRTGTKTTVVRRRRTHKARQDSSNSEAQAQRLPATVLDNRLKQRWGHIFRLLNRKAREADASGHPELGERLRHVAKEFYPTKRRQFAACQSKNDYDATMAAYSQLGHVVRMISEATPDENMVRESERFTAAVLDDLSNHKSRLSI
ncbi:hypothetical protein [Halomonas urumqiensis]|uniref:Uncharacterized protein n=1 Tax=Halomonas urumqiensis TaxID=1684789 RepID=A0A2N7UKE8_9GAMM|nr:hypothetical protein [Halomonas urumqiensis]PMR80905.1 hypothetical protein C1H70_07575 [Halomonas urumqiensis]PTB02862.1 hypothetical protein C6V82_09575 [Halomonas urumqiensis]GHE21382.1 hypothetical protein GCM10017767_19030 [Halomonas urumqiensis]